MAWDYLRMSNEVLAVIAKSHKSGLVGGGDRRRRRTRSSRHCEF